jgi:putative PIN family toxin of toxin-antitoxin system
LDRAPLVILDTNVLVAGLCRRQNSPSYRILQQVQKEVIPLALTHKLCLEYESVLTRDKILKLIKSRREAVNLILNALVALAQKSETYYLWRPNLADEKDNFIVEAAVATGGMIITKNLADFRSGELKFPELMVLTPQQFCDLYLQI